jgi:acetylornithine deacetylase/succinyl-diaminopimelate desuccinylase family protein
MSTELAQLVTEHVAPEEVVEICRDLVRANSENPPGNEVEVAKASQSWLDRLGLEHELVEAAPGRVSVVSSWGRGDRTLLFNGHYDVVPAPDPDAWPHPPFGGVVSDGKLYGRGTTDMKGGIAACLAAVSALQRAGVEPSGRLVMHFVADEEALGTFGTKYLLDNGYCDGATESLVGEPTGLNLVTSERGALWFRIVTEGTSAHGSTPQLGVNAIHHMARIVREIEGMRFRGLHETLGKPTVNVGTIHGGSKVNMVPDHCVIELDRRTIPGETQGQVLKDFETLLEQVGTDVPGLRARVEVHNWADACETPPETTLVGLLSEARDALGLPGSEFGYMGATDARFLINDGKIPTVIFGPGDILLAHTTGEHVECSQLADAARVYAHTFASFLGAA